MTRRPPLSLTVALMVALVPLRSHGAEGLHAHVTTAKLPTAGVLAQAAAGGFGAVIDSRRTGAPGRTVLAVTPGGPASRMGLRPGDMIVSINGSRLEAPDNAASLLRSASAAPAPGFSVGVLRDGHPLTLSLSSGETTGAGPQNAVTDCGYVSGDGAPPRNTQGIYPVEIMNIDGASTPALFSLDRHQVDAGRRVLVVRELVDDHRFTPLPLKERKRLLDHDRASAYKVLIVDVEPDTRHDVGARLKDPHPGLGAVRQGTYWEPVVWQRKPAPCSVTKRHTTPAAVPDRTVTSCAYLTAHGVPADHAPRAFPVTITMVDGLENLPGRAGPSAIEGAARAGLAATGGSRYHRLAPGPHTFTVRVRADQLDVSRADRQRIAHHQASAIAARADHTLTVDAKPGKAYWIGGRLQDVPIDEGTLRSGSWWEPVLVEKPGSIKCP
ncbi:PDZ domain-containing protein [Luteimonas marina]|nr:PDZ domain-containing protein [Luteimonas marina]